MKAFLQLLAFVCAVLFVVFAFTAVLLSTFAQVVTNRETMKEVMAQADDVLIEAAPLLISQSINERLNQYGLPSVDIDEQQLETAVETLLPPGWVEAQSETAVDTLYNALETGDIENAHLTIQTTPLKQQIEGPAGKQLVASVLANVPACSIENLESLLSELQSDGIPVCIPPNTDMVQLTDRLHAEVITAVNQNPQLLGQDGIITIPLFPSQAAPAQQAQMQQQFQQLQQSFQLLKQVGRFIWFIPLALLFFILLFTVRSLNDFGRWWGWPLVCASLLTFILTFAFPQLSVLGLRVITIQTNADFIQPFTQTLLQTVQKVWLNKVYLQASIMLGIGLVLVFFTLLTPKRPQQRS